MKAKLRAWKSARFERYVFLMLLAVEMILSFTFLGYIHIPPISATTAFIPIVAAACLFGPGEAAVAGLFFGLGSMFKASALYVMPDDKLFSPFQSGFPLRSLLLSVGARVLFGLLIGWLYRLAKQGRHTRLWKALLALAAPGIHAALVYGALALMFTRTNSGDYRSAFQVDLNAAFLCLLCLACVALCDAGYGSRYASEWREAINTDEPGGGWSAKIHLGLGLITAFVVVTAVFSTVYFANRMEYMLTVHGVAVSDGILSDTLRLQTQFLFSVLCMCLILLLAILMIYRYMKYREYMGEMDALTGVMGRRLFLRSCAACQKKAAPGGHGWFLFLDVDRFKEINDTLGHAAGDRTLRQAAAVLDRLLRPYGAVGRVGGDEFAAIIETELPREALVSLLEGFLAEIADILPERTVSCSIGAWRFTFPEEVATLLTQTDHALYQAKENGRSCFVLLDETAPPPAAGDAR